MDKLTYNEFLAFLLLHAANDDLETGKKELELIESKVGEATVKVISDKMEALNDAQQLDVILKYQDQYFSDEGAKEKIYADMKEVYMADQEFSIMEQNAFRMLKKIIG
ncbi:MAG: hypothetical protein ACPGSO_02615 [Vicingaceae bacterium]